MNRVGWVHDVLSAEYLRLLGELQVAVQGGRRDPFGGRRSPRYRLHGKYVREQDIVGRVAMLENERSLQEVVTGGDLAGRQHSPQSLLAHLYMLEVLSIGGLVLYRFRIFLIFDVQPVHRRGRVRRLWRVGSAGLGNHPGTAKRKERQASHYSKLHPTSSDSECRHLYPHAL
ncbi:MAG TPA: hypothetical protein VEV40_16010 [Alloacidobacterium sp.]|nr:hypothetical protein [Alloacidobacterium sp.]